MRLAIGVAYDGADFPGWQTQACGQAIQDHLERALSRLADHPVATVCAGRTDAGVHALNQVVHFDTRAERPLHAWVRGVNARLPAAVRVLWVRSVPEGFHARFSALRRRYVYVLATAAVQHPLWCARVGWVQRPLSVPAMRQAAAYLQGEHDFSSFRSTQCQAASPVRTLYRLELEERGDWLFVTFEANAFLHHMVRNVLGALVWVGQGRREPVWIAQALAARARAAAGPTFDASGLYFCGAQYPPDWELPAVCSDPLGPWAF